MHWRKRLAAAQKLDRKKTHQPGRKPGDAVSRHALATLPVPPQLSQPPQQMQLPAAPPVDLDVVLTRAAPKLREHHHEFLSEYHQV